MRTRRLGPPVDPSLRHASPLSNPHGGPEVEAYDSLMGDRWSLVQGRRHLHAVAAGIVVAASLPSAAQAHAFLVSSTPPAGARLGFAPAQIVLEFSEPYLRGTEHVAVRRADGREIRLGAPSGGGTVVRQPLPPRLRGVFVVSWRVVADDGHLSAGELAFSAGAAGVLPAVKAATEPTPWSNVVASWVFLVGLALAFGGLLSEQLVWRTQGERAPVTVGVAVAAVSSLALLVLPAGARLNGGFRAGLHGAALGAASGRRPGALTLAVVAALALSIPLLVIGRARALALVPLAAAAILTSARGHAGTSGRWWAPLVDSIHLLAVAAWVGALVHLALVLVRAPDRAATGGAAIRRYSRLVLPTVLVVLASGILSAPAEFRSLHAVFHSSHGQTLLVKSAIVLATLAVATASRLLTLSVGSSKLLLPRRLALTESAFVIAVLGAVGLLTNLAPPRVAAAQAAAPGPPPLSAPVVLLGRVTKAMRAVPSVDVTEQLAAGSRALGGATTYRLTGGGFLSQEAFNNGAVGVQIAGHERRRTELTLAAATSNTRYHLWLDSAFRLRREEVISPGLLAWRTFRYPRAHAFDPARVAPGDVPTGPFATAGEDGDLAVAFAAQPARTDRVTLTTTVIGPDGNGATALRIDVALASRTETRGPAVACAAGCYRVTLPFRGRPHAAVLTIRRLGHRPTAVRFGFPLIWTPPSGVQIARAATLAFAQLRSVSIDEYLRSNPSYTGHTLWRLEAPDRLTYTTVGGPQGVIIGNRRWDRGPGQKWVESPQFPVHQPTATWGAAPRQVALLGSGRVDGRDVWRVSFVDAQVPAWYTAEIDKLTLRTLAVQMVAPAHFMSHTYFGFNTPQKIRPPR
jgi:copper transport protein